MNKGDLDEVKKNLLEMKTKIINGDLFKAGEDLHMSPEDLPDEADIATNVINQQVTFNMRKRELTKLRAIEDALYRIDGGNFGYCEECDEFIGKKRLINQPWATLCITHAEEAEREQERFSKSS